jgi:hypothetical protein
VVVVLVEVVVTTVPPSRDHLSLLPSKKSRTSRMSSMSNTPLPFTSSAGRNISYSLGSIYSCFISVKS